MPRKVISVPIGFVTSLSMLVAVVVMVGSLRTPPPEVIALSEWAGEQREGARSPLAAPDMLTLADLFVAFGAPDRAGCVEHRVDTDQQGDWLRLVFRNGTVEALIRLPENAPRLMPTTPVNLVRRFAPGHRFPVVQTTRWQGLALVSAFDDCPRRPAMPGPPSYLSG